MFTVVSAKKWGPRALKLDEKMIADAKELVSLMGFPVVQAPGEGEAQIVHMMKEGKVEGCVSQDYDSLLFGAATIYRNIGVSGKRKVPGKNIYADVAPEKIVLQKTLQENGITQEKLIWIGMLIGTDFNEKFPKIGVKTALKLVKEHNSFDEIIKATEYAPDFDWHEVAEMFAKPAATSDYKISFSAPQKEKLMEFLCDKHDFSSERVGSSVEKLSQKLSEKSKQSRLGDWS